MSGANCVGDALRIVLKQVIVRKEEIHLGEPGPPKQPLGEVLVPDGGVDELVLLEEGEGEPQPRASPSARLRALEAALARVPADVGP